MRQTGLNGSKPRQLSSQSWGNGTDWVLLAVRKNNPACPISAPFLQQCFAKTERRYKLLEARSQEHVGLLRGQEALRRIVVVFDEFADLMAERANRRELETSLRICLRVDGERNSKFILVEEGGENLLGHGNLFWKHGGGMFRLHGAFVAKAELEQLLRLV